MKSTQTDIQMRFADIDSLGHVNNVNLQHYFDLGKSDFFRRVAGVDTLPGGGREFPITAATQTDYHAQTRYNEAICVETTLDSIGTKSMTLIQRIVSRDTGETKATSRSVMVAFDFVEQRSVPVPEAWRRALTL